MLSGLFSVQNSLCHRRMQPTRHEEGAARRKLLWAGSRGWAAEMAKLETHNKGWVPCITATIHPLTVTSNYYHVFLLLQLIHHYHSNCTSGENYWKKLLHCRDFKASFSPHFHRGPSSLHHSNSQLSSQPAVSIASQESAVWKWLFKEGPLKPCLC